MESVERGPNNIMSAKLPRKRTIFNKKFTLGFLAMLDDLGSSSNMAAKKQNTFQDSKKSAYFLILKLNSIRSFPLLFLKVLCVFKVNVIALEEGFKRACINFFISHATSYNNCFFHLANVK